MTENRFIFFTFEFNYRVCSSNFPLLHSPLAYTHLISSQKQLVLRLVLSRRTMVRSFPPIPINNKELIYPIGRHWASRPCGFASTSFDQYLKTVSSLVYLKCFQCHNAGGVYYASDSQDYLPRFIQVEEVQWRWVVIETTPHN